MGLRTLPYLTGLLLIPVVSSASYAQVGQSAPAEAGIKAESRTAPTTDVSQRSRTRCDRYAAPNGGDDGAGLTVGGAVSLERTTEVARPGEVVCLLKGTYFESSPVGISESGRPGRPIVFTRAGGRAIVKWRGGSPDAVIQITPATHHIVIRGLTVVGGNTGVRVKDYAHHVQIVGNRIVRSGRTGIGAAQADHVKVLRNQIFHVGYGEGWGGGIGFNTQRRIGGGKGFHSVIAYNIISGTSDESHHHSDGNGIIIQHGGNTPRLLVTNNVIYHNGGRCIHSLNVRNVWVVNNTCYSNGLDPRVGAGEFTNQNSYNIHLVNNLARAKGDRAPVKLSDGSRGVLRGNVVWGGEESVVPDYVLGNPRMLRVLRPGFIGPPSLRNVTGSRQRRALQPWRVGNLLALRAGAAPIGKGIDPRKTPGATPAIRRGLTRYALSAMAGVRRPQGGRFDVGAYER